MLADKRDGGLSVPRSIVIEAAHMTGEHHPSPGFPDVGDHLFVPADVREHAVREVISDPGERLYRLPSGYMRAGDLLADRAAIDGYDGRNIIYPALYCYRHAVELYLKQSIEASGAPCHGHDLNHLWQRFRGVVMDRQAIEPDGLRATGDLVAELACADKRSDGFRYHSDSNSAPFHFARPIDIANLKVVMRRLEEFFECAYLAICHRTSEP